MVTNSKINWNSLKFNNFTMLEERRNREEIIEARALTKTQWGTSWTQGKRGQKGGQQRIHGGPRGDREGAQQGIHGGPKGDREGAQ
jgi:hypothetical protein